MGSEEGRGYILAVALRSNAARVRSTKHPLLNFPSGRRATQTCVER